MGAALGVAECPLRAPQRGGELILRLAQSRRTKQPDPGRGPLHARSVTQRAPVFSVSPHSDQVVCAPAGLLGCDGMITSGDSRIVPVSDCDLELRFTKLEHEVTRLREDVASARALAALADRDVAELRTEMRGYRQVLNALRETQLEQGQQIDELRQEIGGLRTEMREGFAIQATGMAQITALLTTIAGSEHGGS